MSITSEEIQELGINQLNSDEILNAKIAFDGFEKTFGRRWVESFFNGMRSHIYVRYLIQIWNSYQSIKNLPKIEKILERWELGIMKGGVIPEILIFSSIKNNGATLELFPEINNKVPDARFKTTDNDWVYLEVSKRNLSESLKWTHKVLNDLSNAASMVVPGRHGKIGVRRIITKDELNELVDWVSTLNDEQAEYKDLAIFHTTSIETGAGDTFDVSNNYVKGPKLFSTRFSADNGVINYKGTAVIVSPDNGAEDTLNNEAKQLPPKETGVVVLDVSGVIGAIEEWRPQLVHRLQPNLNTRIAAIVLLSSSLGHDGLIKSGEIIVNKYAHKPLDQENYKILQSFIS